MHLKLITGFYNLHKVYFIIITKNLQVITAIVGHFGLFASSFLSFLVTGYLKTVSGKGNSPAHNPPTPTANFNISTLLPKNNLLVLFRHTISLLVLVFLFVDNKNNIEYHQTYLYIYSLLFEEISSVRQMLSLWYFFFFFLDE